MKGMNETESVDETADQCHGGRDETAGSKDQTDEEHILGHTSSVPEVRVAVQAEVLMAYLQILWLPAGYDCRSLAEIL